MQYSQIFWATLFGIILFDEAISLPAMIGTALIIAAEVIIVARQDKPA